VDRDFTPTPWEPLPVDEHARPRQSWTGAGLRLVLILGALTLVTFGGYYLAVSSGSGKVTFGTRAVECTLGDAAAAFPSGSTIYAAVILQRGVSPGEVLTMRLMRGGTALVELEYPIEQAGTCDTQLIDEGLLAPGRYRVTYTVGDELLAEGTFEITNAAASP
jgi:hypothetical protein